MSALKRGRGTFISKMKTIAFDLGRVIFDFDYNIALDKIKDRALVSTERIIDDLMCKDFGTDFEKGLVSSLDFYERFKKTYVPSLGYDEFTKIWSDIFSPKPDVINLITHLKINYPLYMISNINQLHFEYLYKNHPQVFELFCDLILSYKVNSVKPEKKIYDELKKISGRNSSDIVYIDDRQDLISSARLLNFQCIRFSNYDQLVRELHILGINTPNN